MFYREQALIGQLVDAARESRSGALVLRGEAGVGKSAFVGYLSDRAAGWHVARVVAELARSAGRAQPRGGLTVAAFPGAGA